ncbi:hypothetical protein MVES1_001660 [Malassezia vespertilionis]|uniref:uncharacterized protein n=1 Tax=Malassezia vespertilionis TaxID=2020962 RepID=UPI0024B22163|nr:uncharacterized protein MVES1_001660 [Malassezia vespertilionis]WFD06315.1 hypothetical protein MVES1_001660 [Malassezia vespertilionis]
MFKRLSKAQGVKEDLSSDEEYGTVSVDNILDEDSGSDSESDVESGTDDGEDEEDEDEDEENEDEDEEDTGAPFTVKQALKSPIYADPDTLPRTLLQYRCVACPIIQLKNEKSIEVHLESKFVDMECEKEGDRVLHIDPRTLVALLEDIRAANAQTPKTDAPAPKRKHSDKGEHTSRAERKKAKRARRREQRAALQPANS